MPKDQKINLASDPFIRGICYHDTMYLIALIKALGIKKGSKAAKQIWYSMYQHGAAHIEYRAVREALQ